MTAPVFISYSHHDKEFVLRLALDLEERGTQVWIDQGDIQGGEQWRQSIAQGVGGCQAFVLVISPESIRSPWVQQELNAAFQYSKPVVPLIYRKTQIPRDLNTQLERYQILNFSQGGFAENRADLETALTRHGVALHAARELSPAERAERRRQRLGVPVGTQWSAVFSRIPGWALAWGLGWAVFWIVLLIFMTIVAKSEIKNVVAFPIGGLAGGFIAGLLAGLFTMLALRRNAGSIHWRHMSSAIRIWGIVGPIGTVAAGLLTIALFNPSSVVTSAAPSCANLSPGDCFAAGVGHAIGSSLAVGFTLALLMILYILATLFVIGAIAGWLAVRHIRRLEPGILGRQAIWVIIGWGGSAILATIATVIAISALQPK
jgi:hypothetical protein